MVARLSIVFKIHSLSLECSVLQKNCRSFVTKSCDKDDVIQHSLFSKFVTKWRIDVVPWFSSFVSILSLSEKVWKIQHTTSPWNHPQDEMNKWHGHPMKPKQFGKKTTDTVPTRLVATPKFVYFHSWGNDPTVTVASFFQNGLLQLRTFAGFSVQWTRGPKKEGEEMLSNKWGAGFLVTSPNWMMNDFFSTGKVILIHLDVLCFSWSFRIGDEVLLVRIIFAFNKKDTLSNPKSTWAHERARFFSSWSEQMELPNVFQSIFLWSQPTSMTVAVGKPSLLLKR